MTKDTPIAPTRPLHRTVRELLRGVNLKKVRATIYAVVRDIDAVDHVLREVSIKWSQDPRRHFLMFKYRTEYVIGIAREEARKWAEVHRYRDDLLKPYRPDLAPLTSKDATDPVTRHQMRELDQMLSDLPERCREAWLLRTRDKKAYKEVANEMKVAPSTVRYHLKIAAARFARRIEEMASSTDSNA